MKNLYPAFLLLFFVIVSIPTFLQAQEGSYHESFTSIEFKSADGLIITADLYPIKDIHAPYILLFHQARFSRGEYREIAPQLNALGFNCLAVDQRSGDKVNGVKNETHARAVAKGLPTEYTDALPDLVASLNYVKDNLKADQIIVWGSSYSSALVFVLAAKYPDLVSGILSFSPGDYFEIEGKTMSDFAGQINCPVFITSAKNEQESWQSIYMHLASKNKSFYLPETDGYHGSKALWKEHPGYEDYWNAVKLFLEYF